MPRVRIKINEIFKNYLCPEINLRYMMGTCRRFILINMILLMVALLIVPGFVGAIGPTLLVEARLDEGQGTQEADVNPGQEEHSKVYFPGTVTAEMIGGSVQKIVVSLQVSSDQGWSALVDPDQMVLQSGETKPFVIEVTVPIETSCYVTDTITLTGRGVAYPGIFQDIIEPVTGSVKVLQYCEFTMSSPKPYVESKPNSKVHYEVRISNQGNGRDIFIIEVDNLGELDNKGFQVTLGASRIEIEARDEMKLSVVVHSPSGSGGLGVHTINLKISSEYDYEGSPQPRFFPLTLKINEKYFFYTTEFYIIFVIIIAAIVGSIIFIIKRRKKRRKKWKIKN